MDNDSPNFISLAAHTVRRYVTIIRASADSLFDQPIDEATKKTLRDIDTSAQYINLLIGDILTGTQIEDGTLPLSLQTIDVDTVVENSIKKTREQAERKGLPVNYEKTSALFSVSADPTRLEQALCQILDNAVRYTHEGKISVSVTEAEGSIVIAIEDTGIGIDEADQAHLFEKFFRVESQEDPEVVGTGLGLWIARELIDRMGGTIRLVSKRGVGTRVEVTFPLVG
jgi:signal transduction histidine kinase